MRTRQDYSLKSIGYVDDYLRRYRSLDNCSGISNTLKRSPLPEAPISTRLTEVNVSNALISPRVSASPQTSLERLAALRNDHQRVTSLLKEARAIRYLLSKPTFLPHQDATATTVSASLMRSPAQSVTAATANSFTFHKKKDHRGLLPSCITVASCSRSNPSVAYSPSSLLPPLRTRTTKDLLLFPTKAAGPKDFIAKRRESSCSDSSSLSMESVTTSSSSSSDSFFHSALPVPNLPFPVKLFEMLLEAERQGLGDIVSFMPDGKSFRIHSPEEFIKLIMPKWFKTTQLASFRRQLNLYGFKRIQSGSEYGAMYHEYFIRSRPELLTSMQRKKQFSTRRAAAAIANADGAEDGKNGTSKKGI